MYDYSSSDEEIFVNVVDDNYLELLEEGRRQALFRELAFQEGGLPEQTNHSILVDGHIIVNHLREVPFYNQPIEVDFIVRRYYNLVNQGPGLQPLGNIMTAPQQQAAAAAAIGSQAQPQPPPAQHLQGDRNRLNRIHHNYWNYDPFNPERGPARAPAHRLGPDQVATPAPFAAGAVDPADPGDSIDPTEPDRLPCCMPPVRGSANLLHSSKILTIQQGDSYYFNILSNPCTLHWKNQAD